MIRFEEVGPELDVAKLVSITHAAASITDDGKIAVGNIPVLDPQYGNVWTDIDAATFGRLQPPPKIGDVFRVTVLQSSGDEATLSFKEIVPYVNSFGDVAVSKPLLYLNSLGQCPRPERTQLRGRV